MDPKGKQRFIVSFGLAVAGFLSLALFAAGQPAPGNHPRGRVAPKNLQGLKTLSLVRHADDLAKLPRATEPAYDCSDLLGPPKNQGQCGSCWDFSGTAVVEGAFAKGGLKLVLSEQFTLDCGQNGGCGGDDNTSVLKDAKNHGLPTTADYGPYTANGGRCKDSSGMVKHKLTDWGFVDGGSGYESVTDTQKIKDAMKAYGPIGCAVAASSTWDGYNGGVHDGRSRQIDHDVTLVGWDDTKKSGKTVWKMRNSWGQEWGDHGHMWIVEGADQIGTEAVFAKWDNPSPPTPVPPAPVAGAFNWKLYAALALAVVLLSVGVVVVAKKYKVVAR